ncbi:MAG TPA: cyclase family protein [Pyrinomonadaceae bacterium]|nr:cyclase family protein [Pyrinomonadaceae bacterium]
MPIYDVSVPLSSALPTYPGDPGIQIHDWSKLANGDGANVSALSFGAHTGTHVDAPAHFLEGARKVDALDLEILIGEAAVVHVPEEFRSIDEEFVTANCAAGTRRIIFKTRNSAFWAGDFTEFRTDFTYLTLEAAQALVQRGVKLIGIDYLSIEKFNSKDHEVHHALLSKEVIILEGLNLAGVPAGKYELICLPLRLRSHLGDGAPARAVLRTIE